MKSEIDREKVKECFEFHKDYTNGVGKTARDLTEQYLEGKIVPKPVEGSQLTGISGGSKNCNHEFDDEVCCQCGALRPKPTGVTVTDIVNIMYDKRYEDASIAEKNKAEQLLARLKGVE